MPSGKLAKVTGNHHFNTLTGCLIYKWSIFHSYVSLLESMPKIQKKTLRCVFVPVDCNNLVDNIRNSGQISIKHVLRCGSLVPYLGQTKRIIHERSRSQSSMKLRSWARNISLDNSMSFIYPHLLEVTNPEISAGKVTREICGNYRSPDGQKPQSYGAHGGIGSPVIWDLQKVLQNPPVTSLTRDWKARVW